MVYREQIKSQFSGRKMAAADSYLFFFCRAAPTVRELTCNQPFGGSSPSCGTICGRVIQRGFIRLYCNLTYKMGMGEDKAIP